jgi:hypothetical protein
VLSAQVADITTADELLALAVASEDSDSLKENRIKEAITLYEKHSAFEKIVEAKSQLANYHLYSNNEKVRELIAEIDELVLYKPIL